MGQDIIQPLVKALWWVVPGKLAGVRKPTAEELPELQTVGVGAIVSVFHDASNLDLYQQAGIPFIWLPIEIDSVPHESQLQEFLDFAAIRASWVMLLLFTVVLVNIEQERC